VASNLFLYLTYTQNSGHSYFNKKICLSLMEQIWKYVTPSSKGVSTTKMFYEAAFAYAKSKELDIQYYFFNLPKDKENRPGFSKLLEFLEEALLKDSPVAFLNLCNGKEKNLDCWHWVTIISLQYTENGEYAFVDILDDGQIKKIDLSLWYHTTTKDGGFVYFTTSALNKRFNADKSVTSFNAQAI
jgi:hypothetical protein